MMISKIARHKMIQAGYTDKKTVLSNGITVISRAIDPSVYHPYLTFFSTMLTTGSCHGNSGEVHFLEHLAISEGYRKAWDDFNATYNYESTETNAYTKPHQSIFAPHDQFGKSVLDADFETAFPLQLSALYQHDLSPKNIEFERGRILRETSGEDPHIKRLWRLLNMRLGNILPNGNLGSDEEINAISRTDMVAVRDRLYVGSNVVIPVVFPDRPDSNLCHDLIVDIVDRELGHLPVGVKAPQFSHIKQAESDLRLDGSLLSGRDDGYIQVLTQGVMKHSAQSAAQQAFHHIYSRTLIKAIRNSGLAYHFDYPFLDQNDLGPAIITSFITEKSNIRPVMKIIADNMRQLAVGDLDESIERYKKAQAKEYQCLYHMSEGTFLSLIEGFTLNGILAHPYNYYIGAASVTVQDVQEYARTIIHSPIALRADIGLDGDLTGKYVPFAGEFTAQLRDGIPQPVSAPQQTLSDILAAYPTPSVRRAASYGQD